MEHKFLGEPRPSLKKGSLTPFFSPGEVAIIGSFREGFFGGYVMVKQLLRARFKGKIYPVHPSYQEVLGLKVYSSLQEIPGKIDLVAIMVRAQAVPPIIRECAAKGVKAVIVVADGFAERDAAGAELQREIVKIAQQAGMRIVGPNTAGIVSPATGVVPCPYETGYERIKPGPVAIGAQTGIISPQAVPYADLRYGVSKVCDFGNKCDVDECDFLEELEDDPETKVIAMYLEGIKDGRRFLEVAQRVTRKKPVLILKAGRTEEGARAAASHTGSLAGNDQIFEAVCRQAGVIRIDKFSELFELPKIFAYQSLPKGNRLGIVSFTGGAGIMGLDEGVSRGLTRAALSPRTAAALEELFPGLGRIPVDLGPAVAMKGDYISIYPQVLEATLADEQVDCLFSIVWSDPLGTANESLLKTYERLKKNHSKPIATWIYGPRLPLVQELTLRLEALGFPVFPELETAVKALGIASQYARLKESMAS